MNQKAEDGAELHARRSNYAIDSKGMMSRSPPFPIPVFVLAIAVIVSWSSSSIADAFCPAFSTTRPRTPRKTLCNALPNHEQHVFNVLSAQEAMKSPGKARSIRLIRSKTGGRLLLTESSQSKRSHDNNNNINIQQRNNRDLETIPRPSFMKKNVRRPKGMSLPYNLTIQALRAYHSQHGDLVMPRRFVVPPDPKYPKEWHGLDLSSTVYNMRWWQENVKQRSERVIELSKLGFVWPRLQPEWNNVLEALVTYSSLYGDIMVPNKFVVPHGDKDWPMATWGIPLGNCVYRIRARNDFLRGSQAASRREQLDGLGFVWDVQEYRFRKFYVALRIFARMEGCGQYCRDRITPLNVPSNFVIPETPAWPEDLWGYPLGVKCTAVRQKQLYIKDHPDRQNLLDELGFHSGGNADLAWLKVVHAAAIFSKLNGRQLDVPTSFVVPSRPENEANDWPWPEYLWGLPLGQRLKDVRVKGAYLNGSSREKRKRQLNALGFNWTPRMGRRPKPKITH